MVSESGQLEESVKGTTYLNITKQNRRDIYSGVNVKGE